MSTPHSPPCASDFPLKHLKPLHVPELEFCVRTGVPLTDYFRIDERTVFQINIPEKPTVPADTDQFPDYRLVLKTLGHPLFGGIAARLATLQRANALEPNPVPSTDGRYLESITINHTGDAS